MAQDQDLDLVEVAPDARPPVAKLMDYGKFKYESAQKAREARRNQVLTVIKEMKLRPKIDDHDYETKKGHVVRFLKAGDKVKVTIMFRGREQSRPELGFRLLQRLASDVAELGIIESAPKQDGRNMIMVLAPHKQVRAAPVADADAGSGPVAPAAAHRAAPAAAGPRTSTPDSGPDRDRQHERARTVPQDSEEDDAEEQDPFRDQEAGPAHRYRQDRARRLRQAPPLGEQVDQVHPSPGRHAPASPTSTFRASRRMLGI